MRRVAKIGLLFTLLALLSIGGESQTLQKMLDDKISVIDSLVSIAQSVQFSRCSDLAKCRDGTTACSVPACGSSSFDSNHGFTCNSLFGSDTSLCGASCSGLQRSTTESVMRFAPKSDFSSSWELQAFVCSSKRLEADFISHLSDGKLKAWQYIGSNTGAVRIYPGAPQTRDNSQCSDYDARLRPWYIAAGSGPKDVVIVIDVSGSMADPNDPLFPSGISRLDAVKQATKVLLGTMTQNDFVQIVKFSTTAGVLSGSKLLRANVANIKILSDQVDRLFPEDQTNFIPGLDAAFNVLRTSTEQTSSCTRVMLFLTDGKAAESESAVLSAISTHQAALGTNKAHLFTYSMSSAATNDIPRAMACANNGIWASITNGEDPLAEMGQYYQFLARGIDDSTVRWTTPYEDAFGLGQMVTAARAVYDRSNSVPLLVGVVGTDITLTELQSFGDNTNGIISEIISRSSSCPNLALSECEMQSLRKQAGYECPAFKSVATCEAGSEIAKLSPCTAVTNGVNNLLCEQISSTTLLSTSSAAHKTSAEVSCCSSCSGSVEEESEGGSSNMGAIIGGVVGGIVVISIGVAVIMKSSGGKRAEEPRKDGQGPPTPPPPGDNQPPPPPPPPPQGYGEQQQQWGQQQQQPPPGQQQQLGYPETAPAHHQVPQQQQAYGYPPQQPAYAGYGQSA